MLLRLLVILCLISSIGCSHNGGDTFHEVYKCEVGTLPTKPKMEIITWDSCDGKQCFLTEKRAQILYNNFLLIGTYSKELEVMLNDLKTSSKKETK